MPAGPDPAFAPQTAAGVALKRFQAKWSPVRVKKTRQIKNLEPRFDSIETEKALAGIRRPVFQINLSSLI
jgi:hypothetical protein